MYIYIYMFFNNKKNKDTKKSLVEQWELMKKMSSNENTPRQYEREVKKWKQAFEKQR